MHAKTNRQNHDFQIAYFLGKSCHTADGAYALFCDLRQDRAYALAMCESSRTRRKAKEIRIEQALRDAEGTGNEAAKLDAEAEMNEIIASGQLEDLNRLAAMDELATIEKCIDLVQPHRKYAHLPDSQAHEAMQSEEWRLELINRAENIYLSSALGIPADQISTMRMHPNFETSILPAIENALTDVKQGNAKKLLEKRSALAEVFLLEAPEGDA